MSAEVKYTTTSMTMVVATRRAHCGSGAMRGATPVLRMRFMPTAPMLGGGGRRRVAAKTSSSSAAMMTKTCGYTQESLTADLEKYNANVNALRRSDKMSLDDARAFYASDFSQVSIAICTRVLLVSHTLPTSVSFFE